MQLREQFQDVCGHLRRANVWILSARREQLRDDFLYNFAHREFAGAALHDFGRRGVQTQTALRRQQDVASAVSIETQASGAAEGWTLM